MKIIVHRERCQGHARCWALAPDIFDLDDEGFVVAGDIDVKPQDEDRAWRAAKSCPERALTVEK